MSESPLSFDLLIRRLHEGSEDAARELFERYGNHVRRVVHRRLAKQLRGEFDSEDFAQAVWASFFAEDFRKFDFENPRALVAFLATLAQNKVVEAHRQRTKSLKRNIKREERSLNDSQVPGGEPPGRQATPSQVAMGKEQWEQLMEGQSPRGRDLLVLLSQGYTHEEIARKLGLTVRTIRRLVRHLAPPGSDP